ncbi:MAG: hypothetical protein LC772_01915, partial [Chloroflexi bacterium]|nr:hypothetical protein [Chloroflexota bacterium]
VSPSVKTPVRDRGSPHKASKAGIIPAMRPVTTRLLWLAFATVLLLSFRSMEESATFPAKFPAAPGWRAVGSRVTQHHDGPGSSWSIHVNGAAFQRPPLINGGGKSLRITLQYQAPNRGAWIGLRGDPSPVPVRELTIQPSAGLTAPRLPDPAAVYRISLPPTRTWTPVTLLVKENTPNLPYLTLFVGGPASGSPTRFAAVSMRYADGAGGDLLSNGDFAEQWPAWAVHPEWLNQAWAPARFILVLLIAAIIALGVSLARNDGAVSPYIVGVVWTLLSALMLLGAAAFPDLARVAFPGDNSRIAFEAVTNVCLVFDVVCFAFAGWIGGSILGCRARYATPLIPLLAALSMTATAANDSYGGLLPPAASYDQFTSGFGVVWLIGGAAAAWWGVVWACRTQPMADLGEAKYAGGPAARQGHYPVSRRDDQRAIPAVKNKPLLVHFAIV